MARTKHFLDTSVLRSWMLGPKLHRDYFDSEFGEEKCYISRFVLMELVRSFVRCSVDFCLLLDMPEIESVADALKLWSNKFTGSQHKAVEQLVGAVTEWHKIDLNSPGDKSKALTAFAAYLERVLLVTEERFRDTGMNSPRCSRAAVKFEVDQASVARSLGDFAKAFDGTDGLRDQCRVHEFLLTRFRTAIEGYAASAKAMKNNQSTRGFLKIAERLDKVLQKGESACTCACCAAIGDAVIALDAPRNMRLEHTDASYNHLCPPIEQPHQEHPSADALLKQC